MDTLQKAQDKINEALLTNSQVLGKNDSKSTINPLIQGISGAVKTSKAPRLAFAEQPNSADNYAGIYKLKKGLLPDYVIKQVRTQNHLVAGILRARGNHMSMFGHVRKDRFDIGLEINVRPELKDFVQPEQMVVIQERINQALKIFVNCGVETSVDFADKTNLSEYLNIQTSNGLAFGRFSTEIVYDHDQATDEKKFHSFRVVEAGTIYKTVKNDKQGDSIRQQSIRLIEQLTNQKIDPKLFKEDKYAWVQVIDGTIRQAFSPEELLVCNMFPSSDVEHNGYPVTPLDTVITSVTTHSSVEVYNKLYFQNGRAARGMMVIRSDEIDQSTIEDVKQQFNAGINNVANSFRTPIFGIGKDDEVTWVSTQPQKKDGEFQYLFDQTTRNILMAFGMSPDELPGFGHLSRSTNQQSLSESNNEWKLTAARDIGLRPLILKIQDFFNDSLFPIIDGELAQLCYIAFAGFDAETKEQESNRLIRDMGIHYTYDEVMEDVDKKPIGTALGGAIPFNERYQNVVGGYVEQGKLIYEFLESPAAIVDPLLRYRRDQFFIQNIQTLMEFNPAAVKAYYATRVDALDVLKDLLKDYLEEND